MTGPEPVEPVRPVEQVEPAPAGATRARRAAARWVYMTVGFLAVGLGSLGVIVPGLPTTGFFVLAAWAFARSSPRFEAWVLSLPMVGRMVKDSRDGLGMPRRAKVIAISMMVVAVGLSAGVVLRWWPARLIVLAAGVVGVWFVGWRIPTREQVIAAREAGSGQRNQAAHPD